MIKSRRMRWAGHVARLGEEKYILVGKPEGEQLPGSLRHRWKDTVKIDLRVIEWDGVDLFDLAQDGGQLGDLMNTIMNLRVP
jgi:hypothetical protein